MSRRHKVIVGPLPSWIRPLDLLGPGSWQDDEREPGHVVGELSTDDAAWLMARLRGLGFDGQPVTVRVFPRLSRPQIRAGRTRVARDLRDGTPGFTRTGTRLDEEGRFSLTPEAIALWMGKQAKGHSVLDLCAGAGGNAIGFARAGCKVTAIEPEADRVELARHNAEVYGVASHVTVLRGRAQDHLDEAADIVFLDPPWGGQTDPADTPVADLPLLAELWGPLTERFDRVWAKVPHSTRIHELSPAPTRVTPVYGRGKGDRHRIKFLWLRHEAPPKD